MKFDKKLIDKNEKYIDKLVEEVENNYKKKLKEEFKFQLIGNLIILGIPYILFFSWWSGWIGFTIFFLLFIYFTKGKKKNIWESYQDDIDKEISMIEFENTINKRYEKVLRENSYTIQKSLKEIGESVDKQLFSSNETNKISLPKVNMPEIKQIHVDNEERYTLVKKELELIQSYNPSRIINTIRNYYGSIQVNYIKDIPLNPIQDILEKRALDKDTIYTRLNQAMKFQTIYDDAIKDLEAEEGIIGTGLTGEKEVNKELDMYGDIWINIPNVRFEVEGQTVESDNILISKKGIFTVEAKNYSPKGSYGLHITKDGQWRKVLSNGSEEPMKNISSQMNRHIAYKQKVINAQYNQKHAGNTTFTLNPIFVIANDKIMIENDSELPIMRISSIYHHVMKFPDILTNKEVEELVDIIRSNALPSKKYPLKLYHEGFEKVYHELVTIEKHIKTYSGLVTRYGDRGFEELTRNHLFED